MPERLEDSLDMNSVKVFNERLENVAGDPTKNLLPGRIWLNTVTHTVKAVTQPGTTVALAGGVSKFAATVGDGTTLAIPVTHNLNTTDVHVTVFTVANGTTLTTGFTVVRTSANVVTITFTTAPAANSTRIVVFG